MKNFRIAALLTALPFSAGLLAEPVESPEPQDSALVELSEEVKSLRDRLSQLEALLAQKLGASSEPASAARRMPSRRNTLLCSQREIRSGSLTLLLPTPSRNRTRLSGRPALAVRR